MKIKTQTPQDRMNAVQEVAKHKCFRWTTDLEIILTPKLNDSEIKKFPGNPLRVLRENAPKEWSDAFKN